MKKSRTKKKPKTKNEPPMSKGFGHLTIPKDVKVRDGGTIDGGEKKIDSRECWEGWE